MPKPSHIITEESCGLYVQLPTGNGSKLRCEVGLGQVLGIILRFHLSQATVKFKTVQDSTILCHLAQPSN